MKLIRPLVYAAVALIAAWFALTGGLLAMARDGGCPDQDQLPED